jgi:hypothetical protein
MALGASEGWVLSGAISARSIAGVDGGLRLSIDSGHARPL